MEPATSTVQHITALGSVSFAWLHEHGGVQFDEPFFLDPRVRFERERQMRVLVAERFPREPLYSFEGSLVQLDGRREPVMLVGAIQPNLLLAAAVGAKFVFYGDRDPDVTPTPLAEISSLERLWKIDWAQTWPISLLLDQVHALRAAAPILEQGTSPKCKRGKTRPSNENPSLALRASRSCTESGGTPGYRVIPPLFWDTTGRATIHGLLTTAQKLLGERIFIEMIRNPGFVREFLAWLAAAYRTLIRLLSTAADLPVTGLHVGECSACMIGARHFTEFILSPLNELAREFGPLRLHSCGQSDHLLDPFGQIAGLNCLNVGSGTHLARIREHFPTLRVDLIPETQLLSSGEPEAIDNWIRRCVAEDNGGPLEFQYHLDHAQPERNVLQISRTLRELGVPVGREQVY